MRAWRMARPRSGDAVTSCSPPDDGYQDQSAATGHAARCRAVAAVFVACAETVPRAGRVYDEWLRDVTDRFKLAWAVIAE